MAIERTDILEKENDNAEAEAATAAAAELENLREKTRQAELARVKAEAELETTRKFTNVQSTPQAQTWTEEQWQQAEQQTGLSRQQIMAASAIADDRASVKAKAFEDRLKAAEDRAARAEEKASKFESRRSAETVVDDFYDRKPAFKAYKKEMAEFLADVPESDRNDPEKFKKWISKGETYVKGLVGGRVQTRTPGNAGSARLGGNEFDGEEQESASLDLSGLEDKHSRRLIEDIHEELSGKKVEESLGKFFSSDKMGIRISGEEDFVVKK